MPGKWMNEAPVSPGWYWLRDRAGQVEIVNVTRGPDGALWLWDGSVAVDEMHPENDWCVIEEPTDAND